MSFSVFISGLQDTTLELESRVTVLEEDGGDGGNSSVAELEVRVETLEGTAIEHETRLTSAEAEIEGLKLIQLINAVVENKTYLSSNYFILQPWKQLLVTRKPEYQLLRKIYKVECFHGAQNS